MADFIAGLIVLIIFLSPFFAVWLLVRFIKNRNKNQTKNRQQNQPRYTTAPQPQNEYSALNNQQKRYSSFDEKIISDFNKRFNSNERDDFSSSCNQSYAESYNEFDELEYSDYQITPYRARKLLTNHELDFYRCLKDIARENNLCVLSKIRLADLVEVEPMADKKKSYGFFNKISRKHVDFALANPEDLSIVVLIELDDFTHDKKQSERDKFVEAVFEKTQYKLLRVRSTKDLKNRLEEIIM